MPDSSKDFTPLSIPIEEHTLDNGLKVVLSPDATVPIASIALYYDVGSRNEVRGRSGFAHLFEHMMFQGSANVGKTEHFQYVNHRGGECNATTSEDRTNYFETLPSSELELGLWLEADRLRSLAVTPENFENQRQTVIEERRQSYENRAYMSSFLRINELAYQGYWPYEHSTIGDMKDLLAAPIEAVQDFFATWYVPNNALLSICGEIDPVQTMKLVDKHFGSIPRGNPPGFKDVAFPLQSAERTDVIYDALAELPGFHMVWHIPPARTPDHYALELLADVLGDGRSSRLYLELVKRREIVQEIHVGTDYRRGPDLFSAWAILAEGRTGEEARQVVYDMVADIAQNGITDREFDKVRNRARASFVFGLQTTLRRASRLAEFALYFGDPKLIRAELGRYLEVTREDIQRVAGRYFTPQARTIVDVLPEPDQAA
jgi:zinc protease